MRIPSYLSLSRHNVFYFRYPLHSFTNGARQSKDIKLSLQTREPKRALHLSRLLAYIGDTMTNHAIQTSMSYANIRALLRKHFSECLLKLQGQLQESGPQTAHVDYYSQMLAMGLSITDDTLADESDSLIRKYSLPVIQGSGAHTLFKSELVKAHKDYCRKALELINKNEGYTFDLGDTLPPSRTELEPTGVTLDTVISRYSGERRMAKSWTDKTEREFMAMFALLKEVLGADTDCKSLRIDDARKVKDALSTRSKSNARKSNRSAHPTESGQVQTDTIGVKTINKKLALYSALFKWATSNGYADSNIFQGLSIRQAKSVEAKRIAFSQEQIARIVGELTIFPTKKEYQKWGPLLGIFTGARLNELAQLTPADVRQIDGVWCLDINADTAGKHLKTASAKRIVPVHSGLIAQGFLKYVEQVKNAGHSRILHELTYDPNNGYGRNLGRWFNESFLHKLGFKDSQLVFHSLRHTMITELRRENVASDIIKAIVGHAQEGVTMTVYFKKGFKPSQLKDAIEQVHTNLTIPYSNEETVHNSQTE